MSRPHINALAHIDYSDGSKELLVLTADTFFQMVTELRDHLVAQVKAFDVKVIGFEGVETFTLDSEDMDRLVEKYSKSY